MSQRTFLVVMSALCFAALTVGYLIGRYDHRRASRIQPRVKTDQVLITGPVIAGKKQSRVWLLRQDDSLDVLVMSEPATLESETRVVGTMLTPVNDGEKMVRVFIDCKPAE
jgi:hypothetical protein